ncbi:hypothetical protein SO802_021723 [Lithocarpus litseifolius]|uniref:Aminotransferase-like plant mobile domain-containing protein n=1 Tax=Lithocarpus litseifolius TaxID=425828 RepID=A0AAW2CI32_9ROSI
MPLLILITRHSSNLAPLLNLNLKLCRSRISVMPVEAPYCWKFTAKRLQALFEDSVHLFRQHGVVVSYYRKENMDAPNWVNDMAAVATEIPDEFGPSPMEGLVLRFIKEHRSCAVWEGEDPGALTYRGHNVEFRKRPPMVDDHVLDIVKRVGLEGLHRTPSREIDHNLITAFVERWRPKTRTFHLPHGETMITLQDVEVLLQIPIDGKEINGKTDLTWAAECRDMLGITTNHVVLQGQRIQIKRLLQKFDQGLPDGATEVVVHQYARCYILALLGDTIFTDKSGDRVHTMWLQMLRDLNNPPWYSWGSDCLAWLYRELCRPTDRGASQIGGALILVQYWE